LLPALFSRSHPYFQPTFGDENEFPGLHPRPKMQIPGLIRALGPIPGLIRALGPRPLF